MTAAASLVFAVFSFWGGRVTETAPTAASIPSTTVASSEKVLEREYTGTPREEVNRLTEDARKVLSENVNVKAVEVTAPMAPGKSMQPNQQVQDNFVSAAIVRKDASPASPTPPSPLPVISVDAEFITVAAVGAASVSVGVALISKVGVAEQVKSSSTRKADSGRLTGGTNGSILDKKKELSTDSTPV